MNTLSFALFLHALRRSLSPFASQGYNFHTQPSKRRLERFYVAYMAILDFIYVLDNR